jgi:hypothetical protein
MFWIIFQNDSTTIENIFTEGGYIGKKLHKHINSSAIPTDWHIFLDQKLFRQTFDVIMSDHVRFSTHKELENKIRPILPQLTDEVDPQAEVKFQKFIHMLKQYGQNSKRTQAKAKAQTELPPLQDPLFNFDEMALHPTNTLELFDLPPE